MPILLWEAALAAGGDLAVSTPVVASPGGVFRAFADGPTDILDTLTVRVLDANGNYVSSAQVSVYEDLGGDLTRYIAWAIAPEIIGQYSIVWRGAEPSQLASEPAEVQGVSLPPAVDAVRALSPLLRAKYPIPPSDPYEWQDLTNTAQQAIALVEAVTWRIIDPDLGDPAPEGYQGEPVPVPLVPVALNAIARMAERLRVTTDPAFAEQVATGRRLRGFSAGPYSESYFAPGEFARRGASQGRPVVDQDDALDAALWALMTEDARDYFVWRATGLAAPTGVATAFDYRRLSTGYSAGSLGLPSGGRGGPDGF